jgi:Stress responsive A/B Barrel Domain
MAGNAPMLLHSTYFDLGANNTPDIAEAYMAEALQYLSTSPGMISFWIGKRALDMNRPENDLNFDIAMHQLFQNEAAFNLYNANDTSHNQFVADVNRWTPSTTRRVMDTYVTNLLVGGNTLNAQGIGKDGNMPQGLFHSLYFSLTDKSAASINKFTALCVQYLSQHPGVLLFDTGGLTDIKRDVSFRDFEVGMDIIYDSKQAYNDYLASPEHAAFLKASSGMIAKEYVFDAYLKYQSTVYSLER